MKLASIQGIYCQNTRQTNTFKGKNKRQSTFLSEDQKNICSKGVNEAIVAQNCQLIDIKQIHKFYKCKNILENAIEYDKKSGQSVVLDIKENFISNFSELIAKNEGKPIIITLTGESRSGKTHFSELLKKYSEEHGNNITFISTDNYFKDISALIKKHGSYEALIASGYDQDNPESLYVSELKNDLESLKNGHDVKGRKYHMDGTGNSEANAIQYTPNKIIFVEGTIAGLDEFKDLTDAKIYIDTPEYVRKQRLLDNASSRGQSKENALNHWNYVKEAGKEYVQPLKQKCDIAIQGEYNDEHMINIFDMLSKIKLV